MRSIATIIVLTLFVFFESLCQSVKDVNFLINDNNNTIIINYKLTGLKFYQSCLISVYVSTDGGNTFTGPLQEVEGDVGIVNSEGVKTITWDVFREIASFEGEVTFNLKAEVINEKPRRRFFATYVASYPAYLGLRLGLINKTGFYLTVITNPDILTSSNYSYDGNKVINFADSSYYIFTNKVLRPQFMAMGGFNFQVSKNFFLYTGGGFGQKYLYWNIDEYKYSTGLKTSNSYVSHSEYSFSGPQLEAGFMIRIAKYVLFSAGVTNLNFKKELTTFTIGLGMNI